MVIKQDVSVSPQTLDKSHLLRMYEQMVTIRLFEERIYREYMAKRVPGYMHLYIGEEAVAVGVCTHLNVNSRIIFRVLTHKISRISRVERHKRHALTRIFPLHLLPLFTNNHPPSFISFRRLAK